MSGLSLLCQVYKRTLFRNLIPALFVLQARSHTTTPVRIRSLCLGIRTYRPVSLPQRTYRSASLPQWPTASAPSRIGSALLPLRPPHCHGHSTDSTHVELQVRALETTRASRYDGGIGVLRRHRGLDLWTNLRILHSEELVSDVVKTEGASVLAMKDT
jgi:hypothetical protein